MIFMAVELNNAKNSLFLVLVTRNSKQISNFDNKSYGFKRIFWDQIEKAFSKQVYSKYIPWNFKFKSNILENLLSQFRKLD